MKQQVKYNNFINDINRKSIEARLVAESKYSKATILKKYDELLTFPPDSKPSTKS